MTTATLAVEAEQFFQVVGHECRSAEPRRIRMCANAARLDVSYGACAFAKPIGVEHARLVDAVVGVGAEVVALGLQQVGRQPVAAVAVVVGQGRGEGRRGDAQLDGRRDDVPPGGLGLVDRLR